MNIKGKAWKFRNDVNTDEIIPARYLNTFDPAELAKHCMEGIDKNFSSKIAKGDVIIAGSNFGCGSSREHAPLAIKASGISCIVACGFARIFFRNAINIGLPILESKEASLKINQDDLIEVNLEKGIINNLTKKEIYKAQPFPKFMQELIDAGGLINWARGQKNV